MTNDRHRTHTQQPDAPQVHEPRDVTPLIMLTAFILLVGVAGIVAALFERRALLERRAKRKKVLVRFGGGGGGHPQEAVIMSPTGAGVVKGKDVPLGTVSYESKPKRPQRPLNRHERRALAALNRKK